jgi:hypothetical protein
MKMEDGLSGCLTAIDADVKSIWLTTLFNQHDGVVYGLA